MKQKISTDNADGQISEIFDYLYEFNTTAAIQYVDTAYRTFADLADYVMPRRASPHLPEYVREISVIGFKGYTLRIAYIEDKIGLVAAFRPGFTDSMKNKYSYNGLRQLKTS